ncbi:GlxA family transcriptional regulator [Erythrobacter mangrovi]|uniref:AraC family transcriptional regulator n=1 Tax=Erythrobacter mangrovi TaxID=2739433 RepID=A0A7D4C1V8_9SPHN|nr:AraC family transcriptional regulator [Erythrobacter mangrovi]QKG70045.1 AraC family transcriptional regulator [Erythrobacter mangrovi]
MRTIVILAYDGAQILDVAGPTSVFGEANTLDEAAQYEVVIASIEGARIRLGAALVVQPVPLQQFQSRRIDTLIVPGGETGSLAAAVRNPALADAVKALPQPRRIASVCTGAFLLAKWGLLEGKKVTTHWEAALELKRKHPDLEVDADALFVEDGNVWTSAGVSTGIDMSLAMVEQDCGRYLAARIARRLVLQTRRSGNQSQFSEILAAQAGEFSELVDWMQQNLAEDLSVARLAERSNLSERTFYRRFVAETGESPAAFVRRVRVAAARTYLETGVPPKQVAVQTGFGSEANLRRAYRAINGRRLST